MNINIYRIDIASNDVKRLMSFYATILNITFRKYEKNINNKFWSFYSTSLGNIDLFLCPNEVSSVGKNFIGVHQFHVEVDDINPIVIMLKHESVKMLENLNSDKVKEVHFSDPDGNPWIITEK